MAEQSVKLSLTERARDKVREYMDMTENGCLGVRVVLQGETAEDDLVLDQGAFNLYLDPRSAELLEGATVDFVSDLSGAGFRFDNPQAQASWDDPVAQRVQRVIDDKIMPAVAGHGGWVELLGVEGDAAIIQFGGGCQGCGMSSVTLKQGIESAILGEVPEIKRVLDDTDHEGGANPYYARR
jgi:Fe/S biogenesis protein NfuA